MHYLKIKKFKFTRDLSNLNILRLILINRNRTIFTSDIFMTHEILYAILQLAVIVFLS